MAVPPPSLTADPVAGQRLGSFEQERLLADRGAVQWVLAHAVDDPQHRVVLRRRGETSNDRGAQGLFLARGRAATQIQHPGLVRVLEARLEGSTAYAAMDFVQGTTLEALLRTWAAAPTPLPAPFACGIVVDILETLEAIHTAPPVNGQPLVHGGLEPRRIRLMRTGEVRLGGLAREPDEGGTPGFYTSPEHLRREQLEPRSDIFSAALLLYELLTHSRPFPDLDLAETRSALLYKPMPSLRDREPNLRPALDVLVQEALSRNRLERPATAGELARRLVALGGDAYMPPAERAEWLATLWRELVESSSRTASSESVPRVSTPASPPPRGGMRWLPWTALSLGLLGAGFAVLQLVATFRTPPPTQDLTGGMQPIPGVPIPAATPGPSPAEPAPGSRTKPSDVTPSKRTGPPLMTGPQGTLTLVTSPPVTVWHRRRLLGQTPLFNVSLPSGQQKLRFKFVDGHEQVYPLKIQTGKVTQLRLDLR